MDISLNSIRIVTILTLCAQNGFTSLPEIKKHLHAQEERDITSAIRYLLNNGFMIQIDNESFQISSMGYTWLKQRSEYANKD